MKTAIALVSFALLSFSSLFAQEPTVVEARFPVAGACGMCKTRIEKSLKIKEIKYAKWDKKSKELFVAYLSPGITVDSLKHRLADVGHDTDKFKAADSTYAALPPCCHYRDNASTH